MSENERVLCVHRDTVERHIYRAAKMSKVKGFVPGTYATLSILEKDGEYFKRGHPNEPGSGCESDEDFRQLIPYIAFYNPLTDLHMAYRRTKRSGEQRLQGKMSIGVGGHVNEDDRTVLNGIRRELSEEVITGFVTNFRMLGFLFNDEDAVGRVHLGVLMIQDLAMPSITLNDDSLSEAQFINLKHTIASTSKFSEFERWSQIAMHAIVHEKEVGF